MYGPVYGTAGETQHHSRSFPSRGEGALRPALVSVALFCTVVAGMVLLALHGDITGAKTELHVRQARMQQLSYLIPTHKPNPDDIQDGRAWGGPDYNPNEGYENQPGDPDMEIIPGGPDGLINPALASAATGRVDEVAHEGELEPERTKRRNYEFPVF